MSATACSKIIVGVKLSALAIVNKVTESYMKHDVRTGKPTGEYGFDDKFYLEFINGEKIELTKIVTGKPKMYSDEIPGVKDYGSNDKLGLFNTQYENWAIPEKYLVGVCVVETEINGTSAKLIKNTDIDDVIERSKILLKERFGYEGKVDMYLYSYYS